MSKSTTLPLRSAVDPALTWDLSVLYPNADAWEAALAAAGPPIDALKQFEGTLAQGPQQLLAYMDAFEAVQKQLGPLWVYAGLHYATDATDQIAAARAGRAQSLGTRFAAATAWARPELIAIGAETLEQWMLDEPALCLYEHALERLFDRAAHTRSAEVEQLLAQVNEPLGVANRTHSILMDADLKFEPAVGSDGQTYDVAQGTLRNLMQHPDRAVRASAYNSYSDGYLAFKQTFANCYDAYVKRNVFMARARGYETVLASSLAANQIPISVYHTVIDAFRANLPVWHRYFALRRTALDLPTLAPYDIWAPLAESPSIPFEQSVEWIAAGMAPLGAMYVEVLRRGCLEQRWVDIYPNKGKRQGAFSAGTYGTWPYILMNYGEDVAGLSTLAHELGHSLHSYFTWESQPIAYERYSLFAAEVASNFNQALVRDYLLRAKADDRTFQIALIEEAMANFFRYFFIMPTLARFELAAHTRSEAGLPLTADYLNDLTADLFMEGYGAEIEADRERLGTTWATFPHMYNSYYVYQYATGIAGAHTLAAQVVTGDPQAVARYMGFLRAGGSQYPLPLLQATGVDLATPQPVEQAFAVLAGYIDRLADLLG